MLVTDVGDEMCWRQRLDVGDGFGRLSHQHALSFNISVGKQHSKDVTNMKLSISKFYHQHPLIIKFFIFDFFFQETRLKSLKRLKIR